MPKLLNKKKIIRLRYQNKMGYDDIAKKTGANVSSVFRILADHKKKFVERILSDENLEKVRQTIIGDKTPEDLVDIGQMSVDVKINIVEQLTKINTSLLNELKKVEKELKKGKGPDGEDLTALDIDRLRSQKRKIAQELRAQQKFGIEIATFIKEIDFRKAVMDVINQESPAVAEKIYARLRNRI